MPGYELLRALVAVPAKWTAKSPFVNLFIYPE